MSEDRWKIVGKCCGIERWLEGGRKMIESMCLHVWTVVGRSLEDCWKVLRRWAASPTGDQKGDPSGLPWKIEHAVK
jgi:hypothetical protein